MSENKFRGISPPGVAVYPCLFHPAKYPGAKTDEKQRHEITLVFGPKTDLSGIKAVASAAWRAKHGKQKLTSLCHNPFREVEEGVQKWAHVFPEGCVAVKFTSEYAPAVIGADKQPIEEEDGEIYSGNIIRVTYTANAWKNDKGKRGVSFYVDTAQKLKDGTPLELGSSRDGAEDFDELENSGFDVDSIDLDDLVF